MTTKNSESEGVKSAWIKQAKEALQELRATDATNNSPNRIRNIATNALFGDYSRNVIALAKRLHRIDEPTDLNTSIEWDGLLEETRERYIAYAKVALRFTVEN
jgi:hypothetical protein